MFRLEHVVSTTPASHCLDALRTHSTRVHCGFGQTPVVQGFHETRQIRAVAFLRSIVFLVFRRSSLFHSLPVVQSSFGEPLKGLHAWIHITKNPLKGVRE